MRGIAGRVLRAVAVVLGVLLYVWFAAVRSAPEAHRRRLARLARRGHA